MPASRLLAIDVGAVHVAGARFHVRAAGAFVLERLAVEPVPDAVADEAAWWQAVGAALRAVAMALDARGPCVVAVPGHVASTRSLRIPVVAPSGLEKILAFEAQQTLPLAPGALVWSHSTFAAAGPDLAVLLAAARRDAIHALCVACTSAGLVPERVQPAALAGWRGLVRAPEDAAEPSLLLTIGARSTHVVLGDRAGVWARTIPLGGHAVTQALAEELQLDAAAAEALKLRLSADAPSGEETNSPARISGPTTSPARNSEPTSPDAAEADVAPPATAVSPVDARARRALDRATDAFAARLHLEVLRSNVSFRRLGAPVPTVVWLAGGGSRLRGLSSQLGARLVGPPVRRCEAPADVVLGEAAAARARGQEHRLMELAGLAAGGRAGPGFALDLLPAAWRRRQARRRRRPWLTASAALISVAAAGPGWHASRVAAAAAEHTALVERELAAARTWRRQNSAHLERLAAARSEIEALQALAITRAAWGGFLADLEARLADVGGVWLDRLQPAIDDPAVAGQTVRLRGLFAPPPPSGTPVAAATAAPLRLIIAGRILDAPEAPVADGRSAGYGRVKRLLEAVAASPSVRAVEREQFEPGPFGLLRFELVLVLEPASGL